VTAEPLVRPPVDSVRALSKHVLVVEDDRDIASIVAAAARDEGWLVSVAANGAEALAHWRERGADLLVLDLHLPGGKSGADVFETVRSELGVAPAAIVFSAATEAVAIAKALGLPLVCKPFEVDQLISVMRRALATV
jgi:DNA-binding response OmpR family regulator